MTSVPILLLKGLAEGLVLATVQREPIDGAELLDRIERLLGQAPNQNQVFPLLERMEGDGLIEGRGADQPARRTFTITAAGTERLATYQDLPEALTPLLVQLLGLEVPGPPDPQTEARPDPAPAVPPGPTPPVDPRLSPGSWVEDLLELVPPGARVRAPFARVSLDRTPAQQSWVLRVEQHDPGSYEAAEACPLTFLYEAATRLLFQTAPEPGTTAKGGASAALPSRA